MAYSRLFGIWSEVIFVVTIFLFGFGNKGNNKITEPGYPRSKDNTRQRHTREIEDRDGPDLVQAFKRNGNGEKLLMRIQDLDNTTAQGTIGHVSNDVGEIECAALCDIQSSCDAIYFDQSTKTCLTVYDQIDDVSTTKELFSCFYRSKASKLCRYNGYVYKWDLDSCLLFVDLPRLNWTEARARCQSEAGDLVVADSVLKDALFLGHLKAVNEEFNIIRWWLGAADLETEGTFKWVNGQEMTYSRWKEGQPDGNSNRGLGDADCVLYLYTKSGVFKWVDAACDDKVSYICENHEFV